MVLVAWVRRVIAHSAPGEYDRGLAPSAWKAIARSEDRLALEEDCEMRFPGREYVVLPDGEDPIMNRHKC